MVLYIILGVVVLIAFVVLGVLFYMLSKETQKDEKAVPVTDLSDLKKEFAAALLSPTKPKITPIDEEIIPAFVPKVTLPTQPVKSPLPDTVYKKSALDLENELRAISDKAKAQSDEAKKMIEVLTQENEDLKNQKAELEQAQQKLNELQEKTSSLSADNTNLQTQLGSANTKAVLLEEQMAAFKLQMGDEISRANALVTELKLEKEVYLALPKPKNDEELKLELENLKTEHFQLKNKFDELEKSYQTIQYDLIKARAQTSGLERVSFNYKNQIEDFFKKINSVQTTNEQLSQVKNRLEGMVSEVKIQNEELAKNDQLAQFELEKNKSRLVSLEREYEELKSKVQQQGQQ